MSNKSLAQQFKKYQKASVSKRQSYLREFEKKMIYRTTKTENPETTPKMVEKVLRKFKPS